MLSALSPINNVVQQEDTRLLKDGPGHQIQRIFSNANTVMGVTQNVLMLLFATVFLKLSMLALGFIFLGFVALSLVLTYILEGGPFDRGYVLRYLKNILHEKRRRTRDRHAKLQCHADFYKRVMAEQSPKHRTDNAERFFCYVIDPITNIGMLFSVVQAVLRYFTHVNVNVHVQFFILLSATIVVTLFVIGLRRPEHKKMMEADLKLKQWMLAKGSDGQLANIRLVNVPSTEAKPGSGPKPRKLQLKDHLLYVLALIAVTVGVYIAFQAYLPGHTLLSAPAALSITFAAFAALLASLAWAGHWQGVWLGIRNIIVGIGTTIAVFYFGRMMVMFTAGIDEAAFFAMNHHLVVGAVFVTAVVFGFLYSLYFFYDRHAQDVLKRATTSMEQLEKAYLPDFEKAPGSSATLSPSPAKTFAGSPASLSSSSEQRSDDQAGLAQPLPTLAVVSM